MAGVDLSRFFGSAAGNSTLSLALVRLSVANVPTFYDYMHGSSLTFARTSVRISTFLNFNPTGTRTRTSGGRDIVDGVLFVELVLECCIFLLLWYDLEV